MMLNADMGHTYSQRDSSGSFIHCASRSPKSICTTGHNTAMHTKPTSTDNAAKWAASFLSSATSMPPSYLPEPTTASTDTMDVITASRPNSAGVNIRPSTG